MGLEIERKFLVEKWPQPFDTKYSIYQAYLATSTTTVRVRMTDRNGDREAFLTIKGAARGIARAEFEYPIPYDDAAAMLTLAVGTPIEKARHIVTFADHSWEVDVFHGANAPLVVAEIELDREDETFAIPSWLGLEVTHDKRYLNAYLAQNPFNTW